MKSSKQFYGKVIINSTEWEKSYPMKLEYYQTQENVGKGQKVYGIGVTKTCIKEKEVDIEQKEFNQILRNENEAEKLLQVLLKNKVTPVGLKDVLQEIVEV